MSDFDSLRDVDDFDDFDSDDGGAVSAPVSGGQRAGFLGMTPVETLIIALFVLLNIIALIMIILIATGRVSF